jgi:hypothetical protein
MTLSETQKDKRQEFERTLKDPVVTNLTYYPRNYSEKLTKSTKKLNSDGRFPGRYSNRALPNISQKRFRLSKLAPSDGMR